MLGNTEGVVACGSQSIPFGVLPTYTSFASPFSSWQVGSSVGLSFVCITASILRPYH